jgi:hypothetical protein
MRLKHVWAEIRPDAMVETGPPIEHVHKDGWLWVLSTDPKVYVPNAPMTDHISRDRAPDDHRGENNPHPHWHKDAAKYLFPPTRMVPAEEKGCHADLYADRPAALEYHLRESGPRGHGDDERVPGEHEDHEHFYMAKDPDPEQCLARRIDLHPSKLALERFADPWVYFALEGVWKADSILSAGGAAFNVPSVTLWETPELARFAKRYLRGKNVVIVCDADWINNDRVVMQATSCQTELRKLRVGAVVAAPPQWLYEMDHDIKGVDDFLGSGGKLTELEVVNFNLTDDPKEVLAGRGWSKPKVERAAAVLEELALHAGPKGVLNPTMRGIAKWLGAKDHSRAYRGYLDLREYGDIIQHGDLAAKKSKWTGRRVYVDDPKIELVTLRAKHSTFTLGELMGEDHYVLAA